MFNTSAFSMIDHILETCFPSNIRNLSLNFDHKGHEVLAQFFGEMNLSCFNIQKVFKGKTLDE